MSTSTTIKPKLSGDELTQWPPKAHIVRRKDLPVKEGTTALCGAKMMGIDLGDLSANMKACPKCSEIAQGELSR